jgi:DNA-binding CsgD family transcriptional regulator
VANGGTAGGDRPDQRTDELVGRDDARRVLADAWTRSGEGHATLVMVEGEAGVGKSALVRDLSGTCGPDTLQLTASGAEAEQLLDFGVVEELYAEATALGLAADLPFGRDGHRPDPLEVGAALLAVITDASAGAPVLVVVDDAHWADQPSVQAVTFALRRIRRLPVLTVVVHRPDAPLLEPLHRLCADGRGTRIRLAGLDAPDLRELVRRRCAVTLSPGAGQRLHDHTRGNPLEALTIAEELGPALDTRFGPMPAPRSYATLVLNRLAALPTEVEGLVAAIAVLGHPTSVGSLTAMLEVEDATSILDEAIRHRLLVMETRGGADVVDVAHPLLRAAVAFDLAPSRRADLHRRAATISSDPARALLHRLSAMLGEDVSLGREAVTLARAQLDDGWQLTAIDLLVGAARVLPDGPERTEALLLAADHLLRATDAAAARELLTLVSGDPGDAYEHVLRGQLAFLEGERDLAVDHLRLAWEIDPDDATTARAAMLLATLAANTANGKRSLAWARRALDRAARADTGIDRGQALTMVASAWALVGDLAAGLGELDAWRQGADDTSDAAIPRGLLLLWTGSLAAARDVLTSVVDTGDDAIETLTLAAAHYSLADAYYRIGEWDRALELAEHLAATLDDADRHLSSPMAHAVAAFVLAGRGRTTEAERHLERGHRALTASDNPSAALWVVVAKARVAAARGDDAEVALQLGLLAELTADLPLPEGVQPWRADLVSALVALDRLDEAEEALAALDARLRHSGAHARAGACRARAQLAAARGGDRDAALAFAEGLAEDPVATGSFARARLELAAGAFERRKGRRRIASDLLEQARRRFVDLGASPYLERTDRELAACGLNPRSRSDVAAAALTPAEEAVARLVVEGLTNREVATTLVVSVKTVETHLSKVFTKLGVRSRTELAVRWSPSVDESTRG